MKFFERFRSRPTEAELQPQAQQITQEHASKELFDERGKQSIKNFHEVNQLLEDNADDRTVKATLANVTPPRFFLARNAAGYWGENFDGNVSDKKAEALEIASTLMVNLKDRYFQTHDRQLRTYIIKMCVNIRMGLGDKTTKKGLLALKDLMVAEGLGDAEKRSYVDLPHGEAGESWMARPREGDIDPTVSRERTSFANTKTAQQPVERRADKAMLYSAILASLPPTEQAFINQEYWSTGETNSPELQLRQLFDKIRTALIGSGSEKVTDRKTLAEAGRLLQALHDQPRLLEVITDSAQRREFQELIESLWDHKGEDQANIFRFLLQRTQPTQTEPTPPVTPPTPPAQPAPVTIQEQSPVTVKPNIYQDFFEQQLPAGFYENLQADWSLPESLAAKLTEDQRLETLVGRIEQHLDSNNERIKAEAGRMLSYLRQDAEDWPDSNSTRDFIRSRIEDLWQESGQQANAVWREKYQSK